MTTDKKPEKQKLQWYEQIWLALPLVLIIAGGLVGGACGGAAWAINQKVFEKTEGTFTRYLLTGLISGASVVVYLLVASLLLHFIRSKS